jgi:hypothetical protein
MMRNFFPMTRGDFSFIFVLIVFSFVSFLPWSRSMSWAGMAMQGWMMALLMVIAPTIALARLLIVRREPEDHRS